MVLPSSINVEPPTCGVKDDDDNDDDDDEVAIAAEISHTHRPKK